MQTKIVLSQASSWTLAKRVLAYFAPYKWLLVFSFICMGFVAATTAATAWLIQPAMDEIFVNKRLEALYLIPLAYGAVTLIKGLSRYGQNVSMNYAAQNVIRVIRLEVFDKLIRLPLGYFERSEIGALMSHITGDVATMQRSLPACITIVRQSLTMLGLIGVVFYQNYQLALWAILILPIAGMPVRWFSRKLRQYGRRNASLNAEITTILQELLSGIRVIKAFATEDASSKRFNDENYRLQTIALHQNRVAEISSPLMEFIAAIGIGLVLWFGGTQVLDGKMTSGEFFSFIAALLMLYDPFKSLNSAMLDLQNALAGAERVIGMLDSPEMAREESGDAPVDDLRELQFENVTFAYGDNAPALNDINITIRAGERIALVGPSGAGKTTFANLVPRFYDPRQGRILWNGKPLAEYDLTELRRSVAVVSQDTFLFNQSAFDNIAYGRPDLTEGEVRAAAEAAFADPFIQDMPEGYHAVLGERGTRLSGGQKQRLSIARAIAKNAPLLILDEATSALDSEAEHLVQKALDNLMKDRTSIVIAHRLSTVLGADRILVMQNGHILDVGRHAELLERCELYARLYALQFRTE